MDQGKQRRGGPDARSQEKTVLGAVALLVLLGAGVGCRLEPTAADTSGEEASGARTTAGTTHSAPPLAGPGTESVGAFAAPSPRGFDVSHHQGEIDWQAVPGDRFVFVKASEGVDYTDPLFADNWERARRNAILRGPYHMFRPEDPVEAQVELFVGLLEQHGYFPTDLPPALDLETNSGTSQVSAEKLRKDAEQWLLLVHQRLGRRPVVYTNPSFWEAELEPEHALLTYPLWLAAYTDQSTPPELVHGWGHWTFWQHTEDGSLSGIDQPVDLNRFAGDGAALRAFVKQGAVPE